MFSTKEAKAFVNSESKFLSAGIVDNIDIKEIRQGVSPNKGSKYISVTFVKNDSTVNSTFWEPGSQPNDTQDKIKERFLKTMCRLTQIVESYYPVEDPMTECQVENFDQLASWFINVMNARDKSKLVRVKFVYNKDGYLSLPTYAKYRFIEPMDKPENWTEEPVTISDRDQMIRPVVADPVKSNANPFKAQTESKTTTANNPFPNTSAQTTVQEASESGLPF